MIPTDPDTLAAWAEYERGNYVAVLAYAREERLRALVADLGLDAAAELVGCRVRDILWLIDVEGEAA